jgi:phenylacetic acid degradation operon negative regulatory protein
LWLAPGHVGVEQIVSGLGLEAHVRVFRARADELTDVRQMVEDAYDLDGVAARYEDFLRRWARERSAPENPAPYGDPIAARLTIVAEWLLAIRRDPRLPVQHLPPDWPAVRAQTLFRRLASAFDGRARAVADPLLDTRPAEG